MRAAWTARAVITVAVVFSLGVPLTAHANELWSKGDASLSVSGQIRQIGLYTRQTDAKDFGNAVAEDILSQGAATTCVAAVNFEDCPAFGLAGDKDVGQSLTRLRINVDMIFTDWLSAFVVYDNDVRAGTLNTLESGVGAAFESSSFVEADATLSDGSHHEWQHRLHRGYLQIETKKFELAVGRQRIAWGVGRLWNPIDRFSALPPLSLEPNQTAGIDSIDGRFNFDGFNYLQFVFAPGDSRRERRWAVRLHGVAWDADLSAMGGIFEDATTLGVDFARNFGDGAIAFEAVYTAPDHDVWEIGDPAPRSLRDFWQIVASYDINLDIGTGLYFLIEYLYNGNALGFGDGEAGTLLPFFESTDTAPNPAIGALVPGPYATGASADIFGSSRVISNSEHQIGTQFGYDLTPELRGDFVTLIDTVGGSAAFFPNLLYSPLDSLELTLGVQLFAGPERSQFGSGEHLVYVLADWYF